MAAFAEAHPSVLVATTVIEGSGRRRARRPVMVIRLPEPLSAWTPA